MANSLDVIGVSTIAPPMLHFGERFVIKTPLGCLKSERAGGAANSTVRDPIGGRPDSGYERDGGVADGSEGVNNDRAVPIDEKTDSVRVLAIPSSTAMPRAANVSRTTYFSQSLLGHPESCRGSSRPCALDGADSTPVVVWHKPWR